MNNKILLALDTATEACSVALFHQGKLLSLDEISPRTHTQRVLPMVDELLNRAGITLRDLDALVFGRGPGSFTGVRVGVGVAQGLAFGATLPVVPISNLLAMAETAFQQLSATQVVALIDARMNEVYFAQYERLGGKWQEIVAEQVCAPEQAIAQIQPRENTVVVGTGWGAYPVFSAANLALTETNIRLPSAKYLLALAQVDLATGKAQSALEIEPIYLRNEVTWEKLPHKR